MKPAVNDRFLARGLRREAAAAYIGVSPRKFSQLVADGLMPPPVKIGGCVIWDRQKLDDAFARLHRSAGIG